MPDSERTRTTAERIYKDLREAIILGRHRPGDRLNADALAEHHGVSNTPVREALQVLSQEGLVSIVPHTGYYVTQLTLKQLRDTLELREILEVASVERASVRITKEQLERLEGIHAGYTGDDDESNVRYMTENRRFHYLVAQASGNQELADAIGHLHDRLSPYWVMVHTGDVVEQIHRRLIEALREHDVDLARQMSTDEIRETRESTLERVMREDGEIWLVGARRENSGR